MLRWLRKRQMPKARVDAGPRRSRPDRKVLAEPVPAGMPAGCLAYAIGDIHGRADLLQAMMDKITEDAGDRAAESSLILLGDYVDRGEGSREVIDYCLDHVAAWPGETVFLKGNHEDALLSFLANPAEGDAWLGYGGLATLMSYGVGNVREHMSAQDLSVAAEEFSGKLPPEHQRFLASLQHSHQVGDYFFCHAGVDPMTVLDRQAPHVLMWGTGREDLDLSDMPVTVVHGHYVHDRPECFPNRIAIDTGAYFSGRLTAIRLEQGRVDFLNT